MRVRDFTQQNRRAWNEIASPRRAKAPPPEFFADGKSTIPPDVLPIVGDVRGTRVLNLQCANGNDAISFAVLGAVAVGVDISDVAVEIARDIAGAAGIEHVSFVQADVYDLPPALQQADFDLVWSREGIVCWLPDLDEWASVVARALRPGGHFILTEMHPIVDCLWYVDGGVEVRGDYFARTTPARGSDLGRLAYGAPSNETAYTFQWPLGDVVSAIARAGLRLERLDEFPLEEVPYYRAEHDHVRAPDQVLQLPGTYRLVAVRER